MRPVGRPQMAVHARKAVCSEDSAQVLGHLHHVRQMHVRLQSM